MCYLVQTQSKAVEWNGFHSHVKHRPCFHNEAFRESASVCLLRVIRAKASGMKTLARQNEAWEPLCVVSNTAVGVKPHLVPPPPTSGGFTWCSECGTLKKLKSPSWFYFQSQQSTSTKFQFPEKQQVTKHLYFFVCFYHFLPRCTKPNLCIIPNSAHCTSQGSVTHSEESSAVCPLPHTQDHRCSWLASVSVIDRGENPPSKRAWPILFAWLPAKGRLSSCQDSRQRCFCCSFFFLISWS